MSHSNNHLIKKSFQIITILLIVFLISIVLSACSQETETHVGNQPPDQQNVIVESPFPEIEMGNTGEYYVATNGNDYARGNEKHPWRTIQHAVNKLKPGNTLYLRAGMYEGSVQISHSGIQDKPITVTSYPGEDVTITGGNQPAIVGDADYWIIDSLDLTSEYKWTVRLNSSYWQVSNNDIKGGVYIWGNNNVVINNEIIGTPHAEIGVMDDGATSYLNRYLFNRIHDFRIRGIWSQWFTHNNLFEGNQVYNITGEDGICIDLDGATSVEYNHTIRGNTVYNCSQTGIELENSYDSLVENNLIFNTGLEGIQIISYLGCVPGGANNEFGSADGDCRGDALNTTVQQNIIYNGGRVGGIVSYESSGVKVYNNTIYGGESVSIFINSDSEYSHGWDIQGNIFSQNGRAEISVLDPKSILTDSNNLLFPINPAHVYEIRVDGYEFLSLEQWQLRHQHGQNSIQADPLFRDATTYDFHLQEHSPAIDAGLDLGMQTDFDRNLRKQGANVDLGALEYMVQ